MAVSEGKRLTIALNSARRRPRHRVALTKGQGAVYGLSFPATPQRTIMVWAETAVRTWRVYAQGYHEPIHIVWPIGPISDTQAAIINRLDQDSDTAIRACHDYRATMDTAVRATHKRQIRDDTVQRIVAHAEAPAQTHQIIFNVLVNESHVIETLRRQ